MKWNWHLSFEDLLVQMSLPLAITVNHATGLFFRKNLISTIKRQYIKLTYQNRKGQQAAQIFCQTSMIQISIANRVNTHTSLSKYIDHTLNVYTTWTWHHLWKKQCMIQLYLPMFWRIQRIQAVLYASVHTAIETNIEGTWQLFTKMVKTHLFVETKL